MGTCLTPAKLDKIRDLRGESTKALDNNPTKDQRYAAFLRGVNVGGRNRLPMADLKYIFTAAGCAAVQTYIQSGNVVFKAAPDFAEKAPEVVARAIRERFGYETAVVVRSSEELRQVAASNPFDTSGDPRFLQVAFLADAPSAEAVSCLDPERSPPDAFAVRGRNVYLHYPHGRRPQQADERVPFRAVANREHHAELADRPHAAGDDRRAVVVAYGLLNTIRGAAGRPAPAVFLTP